jgi:hypothetical protein
MTASDLQAWQDRHFGRGYGSQVKAAEALATRLPTYRSWLAGRRPMQPIAILVTQYIDRFGVLPQRDPKEQSKGEERNDD